MGGCFFALAVLFFIIGLVQLFAPEPARGGGRPGGGLFPGIPRPPGLDPRIPQPQTPLCPMRHLLHLLQILRGNPGSISISWLDPVNQRIYVPHPVKGETMAHVLGRIVYSELWQQSNGPQSPWVPTGNVFWASGWKVECSCSAGRTAPTCWMRRSTSPTPTSRPFLHARKFAQSDQTADVYFAYPPAMWHIDDIGKFRADQTEGEGLRFQTGAVGRFIHCSGDSGRALMVEDYEGGGGGRTQPGLGTRSKKRM